MSSDLEIVIPRAPEGLSIVLKPRHGARLYRVVPVRDPEQPRFWCLIVLRCTRAGAVEAEERPWVVASGLMRDALAPALAEIQADLDAWLDADGRQGLRPWLMQELPDPLDVIRAFGETRRRGPLDGLDESLAFPLGDDLVAGSVDRA
jgi:hypothetical protein